MQFSFDGLRIQPISPKIPAESQALLETREDCGGIPAYLQVSGRNWRVNLRAQGFAVGWQELWAFADFHVLDKEVKKMRNQVNFFHYFERYFAIL